MSSQDLALLITRIDFAWITSFHIIYPPLTIGLAALLFFSEWRWFRTEDEGWYRLCRFFEKLFIVNFGAGVATGVTMEMAFGILFGPFSQASGPFFGQVLGYETITAFMYEAGFIGLMIFGWGKISRGMHLFATFNVALSSTLSGMWILCANSWMQSPTGVEERNGIFVVTDWVAALLNPHFMTAFPHMALASLELSLCFVAAISAWFLFKRRNVDLYRKPMVYSVIALIFVAGLQVWMGDELGQTTRETQPAALAAMEGQYDTYDENGDPNAGWHILAWPNAENTGLSWHLTIPYALSLIETHSLNGVVEGLNDFPEDQRPPVVIPFYAFRVMAAVGGVLLLLGLWGGWLAFRGKLSVDRITENRWFLRAVIAAGVLPYLAVWTGWWTREIARQPWIVYGLMTTEEGMSHMTVGESIFWLVGFAGFESAVLLGTIYFMAKIVRQGPDLNAPLPIWGNEPLGQLDTHADGKAHPEYVRPV